MKRKQPTKPNKWLQEIWLAMADAREAVPFGELIGEPIADANLFHLAPLVCLKFRGMDHRDEKLRQKVTDGALANYIANSSPAGVDHGLEQRPLLDFAVCHITSHFVLDLINEQQADSQHRAEISGAAEDYRTRTSFMIRPETFQSWTYRLPSLSQ